MCSTSCTAAARSNWNWCPRATWPSACAPRAPASARVGVTSVTDGEPVGLPPAGTERVLRVGILPLQVLHDFPMQQRLPDPVLEEVVGEDQHDDHRQQRGIAAEQAPDLRMQAAVRRHACRASCGTASR